MLSNEKKCHIQKGMALFFYLLAWIEEKMIKLSQNMVFEASQVTSLTKDELISSPEIAFLPI